MEEQSGRNKRVDFQWEYHQHFSQWVDDTLQRISHLHRAPLSVKQCADVLSIVEKSAAKWKYVHEQVEIDGGDEEGEPMFLSPLRPSTQPTTVWTPMTDGVFSQTSELSSHNRDELFRKEDDIGDDIDTTLVL
jgi:hypothetical protein